MSSPSPAPPPSPEQSARELDAEVAVRLFGWRWARAAWRKGVPLYALIPPAENEWEPAPDGDGMWERMPADFTPTDTERFRKWDQSCVRNALRNSPESWKAPSPSSDPAAMMEVLTALDVKGYDISIENSLPDWRCTIIWQQNDAWDGSHKSLPRAVCLAALAALAAAAPEGGSK